jgi:hypothetical protein
MDSETIAQKEIVFAEISKMLFMMVENLISRCRCLWGLQVVSSYTLWATSGAGIKVDERYVWLLTAPQSIVVGFQATVTLPGGGALLQTLSLELFSTVYRKGYVQTLTGPLKTTSLNMIRGRWSFNFAAKPCIGYDHTVATRVTTAWCWRGT